jgi:hypothetical protein
MSSFFSFSKKQQTGPVSLMATISSARAQDY